MRNRYLHNSFDANIVFSAGNINMLSAKGFFFTFKKEKVFL